MQMNLTTKVQTVYSESYKTLLIKKFFKSLNKQTGQRLNFVKKAITSQTDPKIQHNLHQNPSYFFPKPNKLILKFIWNCKIPKTAKTIGG